MKLPGDKQEDGYIYITTRCGRNVLIDCEDLERVSKIKWHGYKDKNKSYYFVGKIKRKTVKLHRFILSAVSCQIVDHINRNTLDNRKSNLRFVTKSQNNSNSIYTRSKLGLRNINMQNGKYFRVSIKHEKIMYRKTFINIDDAIEYRSSLLFKLKGIKTTPEEIEKLKVRIKEIESELRK